MDYVLPVPKQLRGILLDYPRLYAYPTQPETHISSFIILDSGAYALSKQRKTLDEGYMEHLNRHYCSAKEVFQHQNVYCIAPDVFLNVRQSMSNFLKWMDAGYTDVCPVIQFRSTKVLDLFSVQEQIQFYHSYAPFRFIAVSNPSMRGITARKSGIECVVQMVREAFEDAWIHVLGAGWDANDIRAWARCVGIDSIDSIAYYTAAQADECWSGPPRTTWQETALINAQAAQHLIRRLL